MLLSTNGCVEAYSESNHISKIKLISLVKQLSKLTVFTVNFQNGKSQHQLQLECLKQRINAKLLRFLAKLMALTFLLTFS